tara:strand:+ start:1657 stop:2532 length:876 start_codon:yes stop_codon:yes gene_type:complete
MGHNTDVNILNLPETPEINYGDFLLLETAQGTEIIKFDNFIISEKNTTFEPLLSSHSQDIATNTSYFKSLSTNFYTLSSYFENTDRVSSAGGDYLHTLSAVGIGTSDVAEKLTVLGNISASGSISAIGGGYNYFANNVGIGTITPHNILHIAASDSGTAQVQFTNTTTTHDIPNGLLVGINASEQGRIWQYEDNDILFGTNNNDSMIIKSGGKVGIGTTAPHTMLHVGGSGSIAMAESQEHPVSPAANQEAYFYVKADKFIIKFNDSGTIRYKYFVLSGDHVSWVQTLTSP